MYRLSKNCATFCVVSGIRREVEENCAVLSYYTASSGDSLPTFQELPLFAE